MPIHLIRKLEKRDRLSDEEKRVLEAAVTQVRQVGADEDILSQGDRPTTSSLLLDGWAGRSTSLKDGRRQITAIHLPGDFVDLHSFLVKKMDHAVVALTPCTVAVMPHDALREITERHAHLARLLWLSTLIDSAIHREWLVAMGRRTALEHTANLLCELFLRLQVVGEAEGNGFRLPLTQATLSDALGLSAVHVNRVVQELRGQGVITWRGKAVVIEDWERLTQVAQFDPTYLVLNQEPR